MSTSCSGDIASDMRGEILIMIRSLRFYKLLSVTRWLKVAMLNELSRDSRE